MLDVLSCMSRISVPEVSILDSLFIYLSINKSKTGVLHKCVWIDLTLSKCSLYASLCCFIETGGNRSIIKILDEVSYDWSESQWLSLQVYLYDTNFPRLCLCG